MSKLKYKRVLLKISGEALADSKGTGIDFTVVQNLVHEIESLHTLGVEIAIVLGGGNFWRFRDFQDANIPRVASDQIGMLATLMNIMTLSNILNQSGVSAHMYSAFTVESVIPRYQIFDAQKSLKEKRVVLLGGGTGHPFFTTDSAAALRANELECDALLKATKVDGVYDDDPEKNPNAQKFSTLSYEEAIEKNLKVMDQTAFSLCSNGNIPIVVFDGFEKGNMKSIVMGNSVGTIVH